MRGSEKVMRSAMHGAGKPNLSEVVMYAVIKTGGKQYRVIKGETLKIESLDGDVGSAIVFDKVLMVGDGDKVSVGKPLLAGATVKATIVAQRSPRQGEDLQDAPPQALPEASRSSSKLHRDPYRRHSRLNSEGAATWHRKKAAAVPVTAATRTRNDWA